MILYSLKALWSCYYECKVFIGTLNISIEIEKQVSTQVVYLGVSSRVGLHSLEY